MANDDGGLQLRYDFLPAPKPIRASQAGINPQTVDLQVMVSNSGTYAVAMSELSITIPVGAEAAGTLSNAAALPQPYADDPFPWTLTVTGGTITLRPQTGASGQITGTLLFTVPGIAVNETPGIVPITVTEFPTGGGKVTDGSCYTLEKLAANVAVTAFRADPPILTSLEQATTLYWTCTPLGQRYDYSLRSDGGWQPCDCLGDEDDCFTWQQGESGVRTPPLSQSTTFYLEVIATVDEERKVIGTLALPVQVAVPGVSQDSYAAQSPAGTGRLVRVHWLAYNAARCSVLLDGRPVLEDAPTDTYLSGWTLLLPATPATYQLAVVAHALTGDAEAQLVLPDLVVSAPAAIPAGTQPFSVSVTPDGALALVPDALAMLNVVDLAAGATRARIPISQGPAYVAVTPDGTLALVAESGINAVRVVDLATLQAEPDVLPLGTEPGAITVTPDGALALVSCSGAVYVVDIAARRVEPGTISTGAEPGGVAVSADGRRAVAATVGPSTLVLVDVEKRAVDGASIPLGEFPGGVAITPDGGLALVTIVLGAAVTVVDLSTRTPEPHPIPVGSSPGGLAVASAGRFALVCNADDGTASLVDVAARRVIGDPIPAELPVAAAFSQDGLLAVVVGSTGQQGVLTVI